MIDFSCAACGHRMRVGPEYAGRRGKCSKCDAPITVPALQHEPPSLPQQANYDEKSNGAPLLTVKGNNGQLELYEDKVRIRRKGFLAFTLHGLKGDKDILLTQISAVQFRKAGVLSGAGYIQFSFLGGTESKGGQFQAMSDENSVAFYNGSNPQFLKFKEAVDAAIAKAKTTAMRPARTHNDDIDALERLAKLRDSGVINETEFQKKKSDILFGSR